MQADNTIRIALVEDNAVNRNTFQQKVHFHPEWKIVFMARDGNECLEQLKGLPLSVLPQVVFMDIEMPGLNGIQTIAIGKSMYPSIHFIILSVFDDDEKIFDAIKAGASGYLMKHEIHSILQDAIVNVLEYGGAPMSPAIARKTLQLLSRSTADADKKESISLPEVISDREKEILQYTINGMDAKWIGEALNISVLTVRKHIARRLRGA